MPATLVDLGDVIDLGAYKRQTAPAFVHLGTVDSKLVGVFLKGTVKGLLWFNPDVYRKGPLAAWARLQHEAKSVEGVRPWCVGLASDAASGWPGTDWIEDFVLRQSGPQVYDDWVAGRMRWSSPEIRWAFQSYGTIVDDRDVNGGVEGALDTHFSRAGRRPLHRSAGVPLRPPGHVHVHLPRRGRGGLRRTLRLHAASPTSTRASAGPSSGPATSCPCCGTRPADGSSSPIS